MKLFGRILCFLSRHDWSGEWEPFNQGNLGDGIYEIKPCARGCGIRQWASTRKLETAGQGQQQPQEVRPC
jgi:hypothetical protein